MPLGIERINARRKQPNDRINFIKPLEGPDKAYAEDFLERIAAICNPIMKANHLAVMSLEEYAYNTEFLGRNFNAGEVIQLVLKAKSGHWLPFRFVQMVMMHELAHIKQMNHSAAFWKVKNQFSDELRVLWDKGYTGEGMWSRGRALLTGQYDSRGLASDEVLPEHLCGGTYRSSGKRKRASKPKLSWKEQKERRIAKKFGTHGVALGADDQVKTELEKGKKATSKPRVAGSNRGRELRAAAALARFEVKKEEEPEIKDEADIETESASETDSEWEFDATINTEPGEALDVDGKKLRDSKGRGMVKVCDDEDGADVNVKNEMDELSELRSIQQYFPPIPKADNRVKKEVVEASSSAKLKIENVPLAKKQTTVDLPPALSVSGKLQPVSPAAETMDFVETKQESPSVLASKPAQPSPVCPICSYHNTDLAVVCEMCKHVINERRVRGAWRCHSKACEGSAYLNAGDAARCGICGTLAPGQTPA